MKQRKSVLDSNFYKNRYDKIINLAGPRYSPETNVDIPLSDIFHGLCRTEEFYNEIRKMTGLIRKGSKYDKSDWDDESIVNGILICTSFGTLKCTTFHLS